MTADLRNPLTRKFIIDEVNRRVNIPAIPERWEGLILGFLYDLIVSVLPKDLSIESFASARWRKSVVDSVNRIVNLPLIPESAEAALIDAFLTSILGFLSGYAASVMPTSGRIAIDAEGAISVAEAATGTRRGRRAGGTK